MNHIIAVQMLFKQYIQTTRASLSAQPRGVEGLASLTGIKVRPAPYLIHSCLNNYRIMLLYKVPNHGKSALIIHWHVIGHYRKQWWHSFPTYECVTWPQRIKHQMLILSFENPCSWPNRFVPVYVFDLYITSQELRPWVDFYFLFNLPMRLSQLQWPKEYYKAVYIFARAMLYMC